MKVGFFLLLNRNADIFQSSRLEVKEVDFNPDFILRILPKLDWSALRQAATEVSSLGYSDNFLVDQPHFLSQVCIKRMVEYLDSHLFNRSLGKSTQLVQL